MIIKKMEYKEGDIVWLKSLGILFKDLEEPGMINSGMYRYFNNKVTIAGFEYNKKYKCNIYKLKEDNGINDFYEEWINKSTS